MFVGQSPQAMKIKKLIREVAKTEKNCFILGEIGTGKKLAAKEIHERSRQKNWPFIVLNCTSIGDTTTDADLFGEAREETFGIEPKIGRFEQARKGILYLENIQDLKPLYQELFLNILKDGHFPTADQKGFKDVAFRTIASSFDINIVKSERIRKDLLAQFNGFTIEIPPLRAHKEDIPLLFSHFLETYCIENQKEIPPIPADMFESIMDYDWSGNVRELRNTVRNLVCMSPEGSLSMEYLPFESKKHPYENLVGKELYDAIADVEKFLIKRALQRFAGNQTKAAKSLNVSEAALRYKMKGYGLSKISF